MNTVTQAVCNFVTAWEEEFGEEDDSWDLDDLHNSIKTYLRDSISADYDIDSRLAYILMERALYDVNWREVTEVCERLQKEKQAAAS